MLLVLVMLLGVMPMALADDPTGGDGNVGGEIMDPEDPPVNPDTPPVVTPTGGSVTVVATEGELTLENGTAATTVTATAAAPTGYAVTDYAWTGATKVSGTPNTAIFASTAAGTYTVRVTVTCTKLETADAALPTTTTLTGSATIVVEQEVKLESVTIQAPKKMEVGETVQLTYVTDPADYEAEEVEWKAISDEIEITEDGLATALEECDGAVIRLKVDGESASCSIEIVEAITKVSVTQQIVVAVGKSANIKVDIDPEEAGEKAKITYDSKKDSVATVNSNGVVTGKKAGSTTIEVKVKDVEDFEDTTFEVEVLVTDEDLSCDIETTKASSSAKTVTLKPDYEGDEDDVTYKFSITDKRGTISVNSTTGVVTATGIAAARIKVQVLDEDDDVLAECYSGAAFYTENDADVTMPEGNMTLAFSTNKDIKESGNLVSMLVDDYTKVNNDRVYVYNLDAEEGSLDGSGWSATGRYTNAQGLYGLTFSVGTKGNADFDYQIVMGAYEDLPLVKGNIEISYDADYSGIEYSGTYDQALTFSEKDFEDFWDEADMDGDLKYIKITKLPNSSTEGTLYNNKTSKTATYKADTKQEFWVGTFTSSSTKKDLGTLTFQPLSTKKTEYTVLIPFTAYGDDDGDEEKISSYIIIKMNEPANDITSRGVFFGTEYDTKNKLSYADQIAEAYEDATGEDLGYVIFDLPAAEQAHLYVDIPSSTSGNVLVAQGEHLPSNLKLYYDDNSSSTPDLEDAAIIPAAGFSGKIVLEFEACDEDGDNEWEGTITFNVTKKTKSAVFTDVTTSYSWAADSTDFLYYEGTAQGSNGKYNPASNITRGDFMLMLYRAFLAEDYGTYSVTSNFPDVVKGTSSYSQETYQAVGVAKYLGIAQGSNGKFNPTASITREEAMALIQRTLEKTKRELDYKTSTKASSFSDYSKISSWAVNAISELVEHGVIVGNNNKVNPKNNITRAEMACILHRVITY